MEQQRPCLLKLLKENWEELGIALKPDRDVIKLMKDVKEKFDKVKWSSKLSTEKKDEQVSTLKKTTLNLAAADWKVGVNQDRSLNADWRQEKLLFIEDYIGRNATR